MIEALLFDTGEQQSLNENLRLMLTGCLRCLQSKGDLGDSGESAARLTPTGQDAALCEFAQGNLRPRHCLVVSSGSQAQARFGAAQHTYLAAPATTPYLPTSLPSKPTYALEHGARPWNQCFTRAQSTAP